MYVCFRHFNDRTRRGLFNLVSERVAQVRHRCSRIPIRAVIWNNDNNWSVIFSRNCACFLSKRIRDRRITRRLHACRLQRGTASSPASGVTKMKKQTGLIATGGIVETAYVSSLRLYKRLQDPSDALRSHRRFLLSGIINILRGSFLRKCE